jgi:hypothetical protein
LESNTCLYRQWFPGHNNVVADSLSRDGFYLTPHSHETILKTLIPEQLPQNFKIVPLPKKICSFVTSTLRRLPVKQQRLKAQKPSDLVLSNAGAVSSLASESHQHIWSLSQDSRKTSSCLHLHKQYEKPPSLKEIKDIWWKAQSMPPCHMWLRPSGQTTGQTPDWTSTERYALSSKNSTERTETRMDQSKSKRLYQ